MIIINEDGTFTDTSIITFDDATPIPGQGELDCEGGACNIVWERPITAEQNEQK